MNKAGQSALARHFWVSGRVQGVFYRASAQHRARELGLTGWVHNCPDGRVEAVARGDAQALVAFERWLWQGPAGAEVTAVEAGEADPESAGSNGFEIR